MTDTLLANAKVPINELPGLLIPALLDTLIMVGIVMTIVVAVGIPLGALIHNLAPGGLFENPALHTILSTGSRSRSDADGCGSLRDWSFSSSQSSRAV